MTQRLTPERGLGARLLEEGGHGGIGTGGTDGEERFSDPSERARVGDVGRERGNAHDHLRPRRRKPVELGAQFGFAPRDDLVVVERVGQRAQDARGRGVIVEPGRTCRRELARDRLALTSEDIGRVLAVRRQQVLGQCLVEHQRAEVEAAVGQLAAERLGFTQWCTLERGDDRERRAPVVEQRFDRVRPFDEAAVHRLEVQEELGDVLEELTAEHAIGHLVEGPAGGVEHPPTPATAESVGHREPTQQAAAEEVGHARRRVEEVDRVPRGRRVDRR